MARFQDKNVVVTGAASGIGRCVATAFARQGACVTALDQNEEGLCDLAAELRERDLRLSIVRCDLRRPPEVARAFSPMERVDILVNNAGFGITKPMFDLTVEEWDSVLDTNLRGAFLCAREAAARMGSGGKIVNIASTRAAMSEADTEAYSASKGGLLSLTHAMAVSLSNRRIQVNAISPGWIETGSYAALRQEDHHQHPAGRVGAPEDIARACLFLCGGENDFITGANLVVDGGMTRKMIYLPD